MVFIQVIILSYRFESCPDYDCKCDGNTRKTQIHARYVNKRYTERKESYRRIRCESPRLNLLRLCKVKSFLVRWRNEIINLGPDEKITWFESTPRSMLFLGKRGERFKYRGKFQ